MCFMTKHNYVERKSPKKSNNQTIILRVFQHIPHHTLKCHFASPLNNKPAKSLMIPTKYTHYNDTTLMF